MSPHASITPVQRPLALPKRSLQLTAALAIVHKLLDQGYEAYFAGGWVRDCLLGKPLADIDIATSASPDCVQRLFAKTHPIGAHFGCIIVVEEGLNFEVASFRRDEVYLDGRHPAKWTFGSAREDANRRDFTVNGLFYDVTRHCVLDFVGGLTDLQDKRLCCIGDPMARFEEDKLRVLRCARLAAQLDFSIDETTAHAAAMRSQEVHGAVSRERIWAELEKIAHGPDPKRGFTLLFTLSLGSILFGDEGTSSKIPPPAVATFANWPAKSPLIYYLLSLWSTPGALPSFSKSEARTFEFLATHFPLTRLDRRRIALWWAVQRLAAFDFPPSKRSLWCSLIADAQFDLCFGALSALADRQFALEHQKWRSDLAPHIRRRQEVNPLVTAKDLCLRGIIPGKQMGHLLERAIEIAESLDLHTKDAVLDHLFATSAMPSEDPTR